MLRTLDPNTERAEGPPLLLKIHITLRQDKKCF
jgi:hypothetical protein